MSIEDKFNQAIEEWKKHVENAGPTSFASKFVICPTSSRIIQMGKEALPLIRKLYDENCEGPFNHGDGIDERSLLGIIQSHGIPYLVSQITGEDFIPKEMAGRMNLIAEHTKKYLDKYLADAAR